MTVDTHTLPKKLQERELNEIRQRWISMAPHDALETSPHDVWMLLSHIQWMSDKVEQSLEQRDDYRDRAIASSGRLQAVRTAASFPEATPIDGCLPGCPDANPAAQAPTLDPQKFFGP